MSTLKLPWLLLGFFLLFNSCGNKPELWNGPQLNAERDQLTVVQLQENVLVPIGAENFTLRYTIESDGAQGLPVLAYGAYPTLDEAAKISLLFINDGRYNGQQLLSKERISAIFGPMANGGYSTNDDTYGTGYQDSFWSKRIRTEHGKKAGKLHAWLRSKLRTVLVRRYLCDPFYG